MRCPVLDFCCLTELQWLSSRRQTRFSASKLPKFTLRQGDSWQTWRERGRPSVVVKVDLLVVVEETRVHFAQSEGLGGERGRELEWL